MAPTIKLEIVTPERILFQEEVGMLVAPASDGEVGVLPGHYPLLAALKVGLLRFKKGEEGKWTPLAISSNGIMRVSPDRVVVLVSTAEWQHEIDLERAKRAKERAEKRINGQEGQINQARAEIALQRALNRLRIASYKG